MTLQCGRLMGDGGESHSSESDLPIHSLHGRVQVLLHLEERGSCG